MSDTELKNVIFIQYQEILGLIEHLKREDPENVRGYNVVVEYARNIRQRATIVGIDEYLLDPLPPKK